MSLVGGFDPRDLDAANDARNASPFNDEYAGIADGYDFHYNWSPEYLDVTRKAFIDFGGIQPSHIVIEVGAGTCLMACEISKAAHLRNPIYCVDSSGPMLEQRVQHDPNQTMTIPIVGLAQNLRNLRGTPDEADVILINDSYHHLFDEIDAFAEDVVALLRMGGRFVNRSPAENSQYPLAESAVELTRPRPDLKDGIRQAFERIHQKGVSLRITQDHKELDIDVSLSLMKKRIEQGFISQLRKAPFNPTNSSELLRQTANEFEAEMYDLLEGRRADHPVVTGIWRGRKEPILRFRQYMDYTKVEKLAA